ncbi:MAG: metalloregulator ArsR/SmtB family transcription factor [Caldilineaceae bacterium]
MVIKKLKIKSAAEENLESRAQLFKALGHPTRLLIVNLIRMKPRHGEELAAILKLKPATISHHLSQLANVGLLHAEKAQYYQVYSLRSELLQKTLGDIVTLLQPELPATIKTDAYRAKVIATFFSHGRLKEIPAQLKKRQIILDVIVQEFEPERAYTEHEVNQVLLEFHEDVAALRRELIGEGLMQRAQGLYRRTIPAQTQAAEEAEEQP